MTPTSEHILTRLEGHLTEQHPVVAEVKTTFDGAGCAVPKGHGDKAGALAHAVNSGPEGHWVGFPVWSWPEVTAGLSEHPHPSAEHVITVNLRRWWWDVFKANMIKEQKLVSYPFNIYTEYLPLTMMTKLVQKGSKQSGLKEEMTQEQV